MRIVFEIGGIILLINGIGGLVKDDFGLLARVADDGAPTGLSLAAIVVGAVLVGASLLSRKSEKAPDA
ncbi:hypothetical protein [Phytoactinopolyspora mesophila]|uniref:DUF3185 family protein n=1 Tax=Phytoactinopolyspora mesophila TaxID=2650750 RepID=A0A7K3MBL3_9ACTN|nr:hypothetical protein [Phytoactinopolyspora mesophila]NDL60550.1 hypothetical protein [Phytoactinopolyspora mesophila]